jgi:large subunit ribosomal protein L25
VCSVDAIPDRLVVDLSGLEIGDSVHIEAIALPEGVRPAVGLRDSTIASIAASSAVREEALAAATTVPTEEAAAAATPAAEA